MVVEWFQARGRLGNVLSTEVVQLCPRICEEANVAEIATAKMLANLAKIAPRHKLEQKFEDGRVRRRRAYEIRKPKTAKVAALDPPLRSAELSIILFPAALLLA